MVETVGKRLQQARQRRNLSIEEVAHATKLRPEKIVALENDDYGRFASNAYAKGFLQIYARYLAVDVTDFARTLDSSNRIAISDYQYLSNGVVHREPERPSASFSFHPKRQTPPILPLMAFAGLLVLGYLAFQVYVDWKRVNGEPGGTGGTVTATAVSQEPAGAGTPAESAPPAPAPAVPKAPPFAAAPAVAPHPPQGPAPAPAGVPGNPPIPRAEPVHPPASPGAPAPAVSPAIPANSGDRSFVVSTAPPASPLRNEVQVEPIRKTWITVRRDDPKSAPIFEDYLYPDAQPLKVQGARIFIEARDPAAIVVRKNGAPIAYAPGAEIR